MVAELLPADGDRPLGRRDLFRVASVGGGVAAVSGLLAACGAPGDTPSRAGSPQPAPTLSGSVDAATVPVGGGIVVPGENLVVTQPTEGDFRVFSGICTHQGCPVSAVEARGITCPCHASLFDISTGAVVAGPAPKELPSVPCRLEDGRVVYGG